MLFISKKSLIFCYVSILALILPIISCSVPTSEVTKIAKNLSCTDESCVKVNMSIIIPSGFSMLDDGKYYFVGSQNVKNTWEIYSALEDSEGNSIKDRDIRVHLVSYPDKMKVAGQDSSKLIITWAPLKTFDQKEKSEKLKIVIRDIDRCKHEKTNSDEECENLEERMDEYEQSQTARFYITEDENLEAVAEKLRYMDARVTTDVSGAIMKGCLLGMTTGALTGFLTGGLLGTLTGGIGGCKTGATAANESLK